MKRIAPLFFFTAVYILSFSLAAQAQPSNPVIVYFKDPKKKSETGVVASESIKGLRLQGKAEPFSPEEIENVDYSGHLELAKRGILRNAVKLEALASSTKKPEERMEKLKDALQNYQNALQEMGPTLFAAKRHAEFKIAYLRGVISQGEEKQINRFTAITKLTEFTKNHPDSWQYPAATILLIKLHVQQGDQEKAEETLKSFIDSKANLAMKKQAELMMARLHINRGKYGDALQQLNTIMVSAPKDSPYFLRAKLAEAECLAATNKLPEATSNLKSILEKAQTAKDKVTLAKAYNTLGMCYYQAGKFHEARWQFLWVDVVYNEDPEEHAKALYYLWKTFRELNEAKRGQEFFNMLVNGEAYSISEYQAKAIEENKAG